MMRRLLVIMSLCAAVICDPAIGAPRLLARGVQTDPVGTSGDGSVVLLGSTEALLPQDIDASSDLYASVGGSLHLVSGPSIGIWDDNPLGDRNSIGRDGTIIFSTRARLTDDDVDDSRDVYAWRDGTLRLLTPGDSPGLDFGYPTSYAWDSTRALLATDEALDPTDHDGMSEPYVLASEPGDAVSFTRLGTPLAESVQPERSPTFATASPDVRTVAFVSYARLVADDVDDGAPDVYLWRDGSLMLATPGDTQGGVSPVVGDSHAVFHHTEPLAGDADAPGQDGYLITPSGPKLVTGGLRAGEGGGRVVHVSGDGSVIFRALHALAPNDPDETADLYRRDAGGSLELISTGPLDQGGSFPPVLKHVSEDQSAVVFGSRDPLTADDLDTADDIYRWSRCGATLLTPGSDLHARYWDATPDGRRVLFTTGEALDPLDTDDSVDLYEWSGGAAQRVMQGVPEGSAVMSADGTTVIVKTTTSLVPADTNEDADTYAIDLPPPDSYPPPTAACASDEESNPSTRPPGPAPASPVPTGQPAGHEPAPATLTARLGTRLARNGRLRISVGAPRNGDWEASLRVLDGQKLIRQRTVRGRPGEITRITVKLPPKLRRQRIIRLTILVLGREGDHGIAARARRAFLNPSHRTRRSG
jgi:hypothetical protein